MSNKLIPKYCDLVCKLNPQLVGPVLNFYGGAQSINLGGLVGGLFIGANVIGGTPKEVLYIDNAGNLFSDGNFTRDSATNDTLIAKDNLGFLNRLLLGDTGGGFDAVGIVRDENATNQSGAVAVLDGTGFGRDPVSVFITHNDAAANVGGQMLLDSVGRDFIHDDPATNTAYLSIRASSGVILGYDDQNGGGTFNRLFFSSPSGIGRSEAVLGNTFFLPLVDGNPGDAMITDGAGNLSFAPGGGGGTPSLPLRSIQYNTAGAFDGDANFYRDGTTQDFAVLNTVMEAGYSVGLVIDDVVLPNSLALTYYDNVSSVGSFMRFQSNKLSNFLRQGSGPLVAIRGGMEADYSGVDFVSTFLEDSGTANFSSGVLFTGTVSTLQYNYNLSGGLGNRATLDATTFAVESDIIAPGSQYILCDWTVQTYGIGDFSNANTGLTAAFLDEVSMRSGTGDFAGTQLGIAVATDNINGFAAIGSFTGGGGNGTALFIDDTQQIIAGGTGVSDTMLQVPATLTDPLLFGWKALNSVTTGTGLIAIGATAAELVTVSNDIIAIGSGALSSLTGAFGGNSNIAIGNGAMFAATATGGSGMEDNVVVGHGSGINITDGGLGSGAGSDNLIYGMSSGNVITTGRDNIIIGHDADVNSATAISRLVFGFSAIGTQNYQIMFGGTGSPFNTMVIGSGDAVGMANSTDVLIRINNQNGTDENGRDLTMQPGLGTGTGQGGDFIVQVGINSLVSGTTLQTAGDAFGVIAGTADIYIGDFSGNFGTSAFMNYDITGQKLVATFSSIQETQGSLSYGAGGAANDVTLANGNFFINATTTQLNEIGTTNRQVGSQVCIKFEDVVTVKHNTAGSGAGDVLLLAGSVDFITAADTILGLVRDGSFRQETFRKTA